MEREQGECMTKKISIVKVVACKMRRIMTLFEGEVKSRITIKVEEIRSKCVIFGL